MEISGGDRTEGRPRGRFRLSRATVAVSVIVVVLMGLATWCGLLVSGRPVVMPGSQAPWWVLAMGFAATEACVFHLQVRREARTLSLSELPLVVGLFLASPIALVLGRALGSAVVLVCYRRSPAVKTVFNLVVGTAECAVALAVFAALEPRDAGVSVASYLVATAAALAANSVGVVATGAVIAVHECEWSARGLARHAFVQPALPLSIALALVAVAGLSASPAAGWPLGVVAGLVLLAFRVHARLSDRHLNLRRLYRFSQTVSSATEIDELMAALLHEARDLLLAERASAAFVAADGGLLARVRIDARGQLARSSESPSPADVHVLDTVLQSGSALLMQRSTREPILRAWLDQYQMRDAVAVPLGGATGIAAVLVVADRLGDVRGFEPSDVPVLETVANHAGVALRNGELLGQLRHDAAHDPLTGLPNREQLRSELDLAVQQVATGRIPGSAVLVLDLDQFQDVNDALGREHGDLLLIEIGRRLAAEVGADGRFARLASDEFAVLLPEVTDPEPVMRLGRRLLRVLEEPFAVAGLKVTVGASIGAVLAPAHGADAETLLMRADRATREAKGSTGRLRLYQAERETDSPRRLAITSDLRAALAAGQIECYVQPQATASGGRVVAVEALARWKHPDLGPISPEEFIPAAERSGMIGQLTSGILNASLRACAEWRAAGRELGIAVNLSTHSLLDTDLIETVRSLLRRYDVPADRLTLEVTEGSVMADPERAVALLHQLRELGVRLSVDDFGTGYSSLSYLKRLPVHEVKIDRSFVLALREAPEDLAIVRAIIDLAGHLDLHVVAEGVEDGQTWRLLSQLGCHLIQGYHLARPMPIEQLLPWLTRQPSIPLPRDALVRT